MFSGSTCDRRPVFMAKHLSQPMWWLCKYRTAWRSCHLQVPLECKLATVSQTGLPTVSSNTQRQRPAKRIQKTWRMRFNVPTAKEHKVPNHILIVAQVARRDLSVQSTKTLKCVPNSVKSVSFCVVWGEETNGLHDKLKIYAPKTQIYQHRPQIAPASFCVLSMQRKGQRRTV